MVRSLSRLSDAVKQLQRGGLVLLHDFNSRENETDMIMAAEKVTPAHIGIMRNQAGGLICVGIESHLAERIGLPFLSELLEIAGDKYPWLKQLTNGENPYGGKPAFSISVNHRDTFTGITDRDRALTIRKLVEVFRKAKTAGNGFTEEFARQFRAPGHVHLLRASNGLLSERRGHTELSVYLAELAGVTPVTVICEMLDADSYGALTAREAEKYAVSNDIPFLEGKEVLKHYQLNHSAS